MRGRQWTEIGSPTIQFRHKFLPRPSTDQERPQQRDGRICKWFIFNHSSVHAQTRWRNGTATQSVHFAFKLIPFLPHSAHCLMRNGTLTQIVHFGFKLILLQLVEFIHNMPKPKKELSNEYAATQILSSYITWLVIKYSLRPSSPGLIPSSFIEIKNNFQDIKGHVRHASFQVRPDLTALKSQITWLWRVVQPGALLYYLPHE